MAKTVNVKGYTQDISERKSKTGKTTLKEIPKELRGLWKIQYAPREQIILNNVDKKGLKLWKSLSIWRKINTIDNMQAKGLFGSE